jgi:hypothetical protein
VKNIQKNIAVFLIVCICWLGIIPGIVDMPFIHAEELSQINMTEVDSYLAKALKIAYQNTENYAKEELDLWINQQMQKVDHNFLPWYFGYLNQKSMEFGVPFAWAAFTVDSWLKILRNEDEKELSVDEIIQKRMIEDFQNKFQDLVLNEDSGRELELKLKAISRNYTSVVNVQFAQVKAFYKIPDQIWESHLQRIANLIYDTGMNSGSLNAGSINSKFSTKLMNATTSIISAKVVAKLVAKIAPKILAKGGGAMALKVGAQFVEPALLIGFLVWDIVDYQNMVNSSQPVLRENLSDYFQELKASLLDNTDNGIMTAIGEVQEQILTAL